MYNRVTVKIYFKDKDDLDKIAKKFKVSEVNMGEKSGIVMMRPNHYVEFSKKGYKLEIDDKRSLP